MNRVGPTGIWDVRVIRTLSFSTCNLLQLRFLILNFESVGMKQVTLAGNMSRINFLRLTFSLLVITFKHLCIPRLEDVGTFLSLLKDQGRRVALLCCCEEQTSLFLLLLVGFCMRESMLHLSGPRLSSDSYLVPLVFATRQMSIIL